MLSRSVGAAAVALREDTPGKPMLVGYLARASAEGRSDEALRAKLAEDLPDYMIPSIWVRLDSLPVTPNGKLDRAALPAPDITRRRSRRSQRRRRRSKSRWLRSGRRFSRWTA